MPPYFLSNDGPTLLRALLAELAPSQTCLVADETAWELHAERWSTVFTPDTPTLTLPLTEPNKQLATCQRLWEAWDLLHLDRQALVVVMGGGVATDLGAMAASLWLRGIRFVLVPTTLLGMVDASIGGKTGVDFRNGKNRLGSFSLPEAIVADPRFLQTLPPEQLQSGWAEVLKHALLTDGGWYQRLTTDKPATPDWHAVIREAVAVKSRIVAADPQEKGERALLNLGHTLGHAIESALLARGTPMLHGLAVAIGMAAEARLAQDLGLLPKPDADCIVQGLALSGYTLALPQLPFQELIQWLQKDKKNQGDAVRFVLPTKLGQASYGNIVSLEAVATSWHKHGFSHPAE